MSERLTQRLDIPLPIILHHQGASEPCLSRTLSPRGMLVATRQRWPVGTVIAVEIVHRHEHVPATARIASHVGNGMGLEFLASRPDFGGRLADIIAAFLPAGLEPAARTVPAENYARLTWRPRPDGKWWHLWGQRRRQTRFIDVSFDGAAIEAKRRPAVGSEVIVLIEDRASNQAPRTQQTQARVVRHTEHGFAVQFIKPQIAFRRVVSEIRRASRGRERVEDATRE
jgi:hypothetical protein